jgi:hypothetical protein
MTSIAPTLQGFFTERLISQRNVSSRTIASYRDSLKLLLTFAQQRTGKPPHVLDWADLDAELITAFLEHLETGRHNTTRSSKAQLANGARRARRAARGRSQARVTPPRPGRGPASKPPDASKETPGNRAPEGLVQSALALQPVGPGTASARATTTKKPGHNAWAVLDLNQ